MATASFSIAKYGKVRGSGPAALAGEYVDGGAHTTTASATNLTDGAAGSGSAITAVKGDTLYIIVDGAARIRFGGVAATATAGHYIAASTPREFEISASGTISIIDA